jgi:hypothetical protein
VTRLDETLQEAVDWAGVSRMARVVYQQRACYCFGEAVTWSSQKLIGRDLGVSQPTVSRADGELCKTGRMRLVGRRWSPRTGWMHNVYELLVPWNPISRWVADHIVERGLFRGWKARFDARYRAVNTNRRLSPTTCAEPRAFRSSKAACGVDEARRLGESPSPTAFGRYGSPAPSVLAAN